MTNIYWPVYKNLEAELLRLSYDIHIDDNQLNVYSLKISDLILRSSAEIESISKDLYKSNGGKKTDNIYYDEDAIKYLNGLWKLDQKVVLLSSINCFQSNRELKPFKKNERKTSNGKLTFSWNNAYQNLKHNRANSLQYGNLKYLFDILAALFVLNLYYKNEIINLNKDFGSANFPINLGSEVFAIKLHNYGYDGRGNYLKKPDYDECIYLTKFTDKSHEAYIRTANLMSVKHAELIKKKGYSSLEQITPNEWSQLSLEHTVSLKNAEYEAILNTNCL